MVLMYFIFVQGAALALYNKLSLNLLVVTLLFMFREPNVQEHGN